MRNLFLSTCILFLVGCGPGLHVFNSANPPCINAARQLNANAFVGTDHLEFQAAASPTNHLGIMINQYTAFQSSMSKGTNLFEGAVGYYLPFDKDWNFDVYAGGGYGERSFNGIPNSSWPTGNKNLYNIQTYYSKYFVQPSLFVKRNHFEFAFSFQFALYNFDHVHYFKLRPADDNFQYDQIFTFNYTNQQVFNLNPAFTIKFGLNRLKLIVQMATNFRFQNPFYDNITGIGLTPFNSRLGELNAGIQFSLHKPLAE